jgi:hypothetical protein
VHHQRAYVGGGLQPWAALVVVCLTVVTLPPRSTTPTVAGCRLVGCSVVSGRPLRSRAVAGVLLHVCVCLGPVLAENPSNSKGARHKDTREHFVDQLVKDHIVKLLQCRTKKMVADALTKNLSAPVFEQHRAPMLGEDETPFSAMMCRM